MLSLKSASSLMILAAAVGFSAAAPATAQEYGYSTYGPPPPPNEEVIVTAPRPNFREEYGSGARSLDLPPAKVSLSKVVHYEDLDLASWDGAAELRHRVRAAAHHVCLDLLQAYPLHQVNGSNCYRDAVRDGLVRADEAIATTRTYRGGYGYVYDTP